MVLINNRIMKGDEMSVDYRENQPAKKMDIKRLIEASANNMLSELSCDCRVHGQYKKDACEEDCLSEMKFNNEKQVNPNNPFYTC